MESELDDLRAELEEVYSYNAQLKNKLNTLGIQSDDDAEKDGGALMLTVNSNFDKENDNANMYSDTEKSKNKLEKVEKVGKKKSSAPESFNFGRMFGMRV